MNNKSYTYQQFKGVVGSFCHQVAPFFFLFFLILPLCTGCMKEDYSLCVDNEEETRLLLSFTYTDSKEGNKFTEEIQQVDVALFNEDFEFYRIVTLNKNELDKAPETSFVIEPGIYYIVGWGNIAENSRMSTSTNSTSFSQSFVSHIGNSTIDSIYYAPDTRLIMEKDESSVNQYSRYEVVVEKNKVTKHVLPFMSAYHTINVYLTGLENIEDLQTEKPEIYVLNLSSGYTYELDYSDEKTIDLQKRSRLEYLEQNPLLFANFLVPHFSNENDIRIQVVRMEAGEKRIDELILSKFLNEKKITVSDGGKEVINIEFKYEEEYLVSINLPEWIGQSVNPGFD